MIAGANVVAWGLVVGCGVGWRVGEWVWGVEVGMGVGAVGGLGVVVGGGMVGWGIFVMGVVVGGLVRWGRGGTGEDE